MTVVGARLVCVKGHGSPGWPLLGHDEDLVAALVRDRCAICPDEPLSDGVCSCCGSTWRLDGNEVTCLPGPRTRLIE
jgi:hypothetical protein